MYIQNINKNKSYLNLSSQGHQREESFKLRPGLNEFIYVTIGEGASLPIHPKQNEEIVVVNQSTIPLLIYPHENAQINRLGIGSTFNLMPVSAVIFRAASTNQWYSVGKF